MSGVLESYIFTGLAGNVAYRVAKDFWQQVFGKDLEELFLDAFTQAVKNQKEHLGKYGNPIKVDSQALLNVLRNRPLHVERKHTARMNDTDFTRYLAQILREKNVLILGGHNLDIEGYEQILRNLLKETRAIFRRRVVANQIVFNDLLLAEVEDDRRKLADVLKFLSERFDLVLSKLDAIQGCPQSVAGLRGEIDILTTRAMKVPGGSKPAHDSRYLDANGLPAGSRLSLAELRRIIVKYLDLEELRTLCQDLGIDYDSLRGEGKTGKARELIGLMERRGRLLELEAVVVVLPPESREGK
ncbi:hypothetical protein ACFL6S_06505 [Candidatus Poribacteria bacterium]